MTNEQKQEISEEFDDFEMSEIKGLMVNVYGNPNIILETEKQIDDFLDDVKKIILAGLFTIIDKVLADKVKENTELKLILQNAWNVGHNNDCLFCGFKDREIAKIIKG